MMERSMPVGQITDRLDDLPLTRRHWRVILGGAAVFAAAVHNVMIVAFVLARLFREWSLSPVQVGLVNSLAIVGMLAGSLTGGYLADRFGRKPAILGSLIMACTFSALSAVAWDLLSFILFRMLAGAGGAAAFATTPILLAEFSPRRTRGRIMILTEVAWALGASLAALVGYEIIPAFGWRVALVVGGLPLLALPAFFWAISESPRFLIGKGKVREAVEIVRSFEVAAGRPALASLEGIEIRYESRSGSPDTSAIRRVWKPRFRRQTLVLWALWFSVNSTYFGVYTWLPSLMVARGIGEESSFAWNLYMSAMLAPGAVIGGFLADHWGRKATITLTLICNGIATFFFGLTATPTTFLVWGGLFALSHQAIWVATMAYTNEMYPSDIRAQGASYAAATGRVGSIIAPYAIGSLMAGLGAELGYTVSFSMFALLLFLGGFLVLGLGIETRGRSLEELTT
ncbi:MAG TPA: MFS transporter [bacterium]|nr:MFS transporter [bacterium]